VPDSQHAVDSATSVHTYTKNNRYVPTCNNGSWNTTLQVLVVVVVAAAVAIAVDMFILSSYYSKNHMK